MPSNRNRQTANSRRRRQQQNGRAAAAKQRSRKQDQPQKAKRPLLQRLFNRYGTTRVGEINIVFLLLIMTLLVLGVVMMYSASYAWAIKDGHPSDHYFKHQLIMACGGVAVMLFFTLVDYHWLKAPPVSFGLYGLCLVLEMLCFVPAFQSANDDANRWFTMPGINFQFQPSEPMKLALILTIALLISSNASRITEFKHGVFPGLVYTMIACGMLAAQRHISGLLITLAIGMMLIFIGGVRMKDYGLGWLIVAIFGVLGGGVLMATNKFNYIASRITVWRDPFGEDVDPDLAWQIQNSLIAIGSGGPFGLGIGNSRQKFLYLPESKNDFVFAIVCEELGFVGAVVVILIFLLLVVVGFQIASNSTDKFGMLVAAGITFQIGIQALLNVAVVTNTLPNTGIPLPFFSYGGTALIIQLAEMGIVLNISRHSIPDKGGEDADEITEPNNR